MSTWLGRRRNALQEAAQLLDDLGLDQSQPVDVFDAIRRLDIWLTFLPLRNLLGACLPTGSGGIIITSQRRAQIQRYTAAHEVGHWMLDHHSLSLDSEQDVFRPSKVERERLAQIFAGYFLMPPQLLHAVAGHHSLDSKALPEPGQVYLAARDMGVSYEAALRQLTEVRYLTDGQRDALLRISPLKAKQSLTHGIRPVDGHADVWPVDEHANGGRVDVLVNDELVITLPENRTTGYRWMDESGLLSRSRHTPHPAPPPFARPARASSESDTRLRDEGQPLAAAREPSLPVSPITVTDLTASGMEVVADNYSTGWADLDRRGVRLFRRSLRPETARAERRHLASVTGGSASQASAATVAARPGVGATGRRWLSVQAQAEGNWRCVLHYASAYDASAPPVMTFIIETNVRPEPAVLHRRALLDLDLNRVGPAGS